MDTYNLYYYGKRYFQYYPGEGRVIVNYRPERDQDGTSGCKEYRNITKATEGRLETLSYGYFTRFLAPSHTSTKGAVIFISR